MGPTMPTLAKVAGGGCHFGDYTQFQMDGHPWALYDLRIWTERLELRLPTEDEL